MRFLVTMLFLSIASVAHASDLTVCVNSRGNLVAKKTCSSGETKLTASNLEGFVGTSSTGAFDVSKCRRVENLVTNQNSNSVAATAACKASEYVLTNACQAKSGYAIASAHLRIAAAGGRVYDTLDCIGVDSSNANLGNYWVRAQVLCCPK